MSLKDRVQILDKTVLADDWAVLTKYTVRYTRRDGSSQTLPRETYDRGNGATILPYDPDRGTVLLGRQFRLTAYLNGHDDLLIEALHLAGRDEEAKGLFCTMLGHSTRSGLLSEDLDFETGELWGNFPQTYSLVGVINGAGLLSRPWSEIR